MQQMYGRDVRGKVEHFASLGELVYRLKYKRDKSGIAAIVEVTAEFVKKWGIKPDVLVPMPPSKQRADQPVLEIASALSKALEIELDPNSVRKTKSTSQMKDIGDYAERVAALKGVVTVGSDLKDRQVLLIDDLFQSGASMNVVAEAIRQHGKAKTVYAIALTRTRS